MNYEEALKIVDKILSRPVPFDDSNPNIYKIVKENITRELADELVKAWDFGYSSAEDDSKYVTVMDSGY